MLRMSMWLHIQKILDLKCNFEGKKLDAKNEYEGSVSENTCFEM